MALLPLLVLGLASSPATAQQASAPDLGTLALTWARGDYATPLVCEIDGQPVRGLRRVLIAPVPKRLGHPAAKITFVDLEPGEARRCFNDFGQPEPDLEPDPEPEVPPGCELVLDLLTREPVIVCP